MPLVILDDSEEEEDLLEGSAEPATAATIARKKPSAQQSTGSTERLRQDILDAERELRAVSTDPDESPNMSRTRTTTIIHNVKRSRSEMANETPTTRQSGRTLKRAKTAKDDVVFSLSNGTQDEIIVGGGKNALKSPSIDVGALGQSFLNRDTMFEISGDTVAYNEQTQQQIADMIAQPAKPALSSKKPSHDTEDHNGLRDSSFPWTAHESLPSTNNGPQTDITAPRLSRGTTPGLAMPVTQVSLPGEAQELIEQYLDFNRADPNADASTHLPQYGPGSHDCTSSKDRRAQSRQVELQGSQDELALLTEAPSATARSKLRARTLAHKAEEHAISLTHEQSLQPDELAGTGQPLTVEPTGLNPVKTVPMVSPSQASLSQEIVVAAPRQQEQREVSEPVRHDPQMPILMDTVIQLLQKTPVRMTDPFTVQTDELVRQDTLSPEFVVPPATARGKKSAKKKTKRSHTTIFEDCVDHKMNSESLNLSQQQAQRKAALDPIDNNTKPRLRGRGRGKVLADEREDESAKQAATEITIAEKQVPAPGEYHPPEEEEEDVIVCAQKTKPADIGNMPKHVIEAPSILVIQPIKTGRRQQESSDGIEHVQLPNSEESTLPDKPTVSEVGPARPSTDSPDRQWDQSVALRSSPTTHSPIKLNTTTKFRVGLSKRQRIPSLLKVVRPAKQT